jgi:beta-lactam-binding protein with PASTA domain
MAPAVDLQQTQPIQAQPMGAARPPEKKGGHLWLWIVGGLLAAIVIVAIILGVSRDRTVEVPDLTGLSLPQAVAALTEADLRLGEVSYTSQVPAGMEEGQAVAQDPAAGTEVDLESAVNVLVAGKAEIEVPEVTGLTADEATQTLEGAGFTVKTVEVENEAEPGAVVDQSPAGGSMVTPGSEVTIVVSAGRTVTLVPNVVGMSQEEATAALQEAGYEVQAKGTYDEQVEDGKVIGQSPEGGTEAEPGTRVDIFVSQGKNPEAAVPDVVGMSEAEAAEALEAAGFEAVPGSTFSDTVPLGQVISQDPEAGTTAQRGSGVALVVSQGPMPTETTTVPDVIGRTETEATEILEAAGYLVASAHTYSEVVPIDLVGIQAPVGGNVTEPGITVAILVSDGPRPAEEFVIVPDLRGISLEEASAVLEDLGLEVLSFEFFTELAPAGQVAAQLPPPESSVAPGATVLLLISKGPYLQVNPL